MKYMGSKNRISKEILPIILKDRKEEQYYIEPFVGGFNLIDKVKGNRIANDKNKYLIEMWKGIQKNKERPYKITKDMYDKARKDYRNKENKYYNDFLIGWIGWMGSFNGRFYDGGYAGNHERDYISEQIRNTEKQIEQIKGIKLNSKDYDKLEIPPKSIIYCDPPYQGTKKYDVSKDFDYDKFWNWVKEKTIEGHKVYVSEYTAPEEFTIIWEKELNNTMSLKNTTKPMEKIFIYKID